jgi:hypothetical protein
MDRDVMVEVRCACGETSRAPLRPAGHVRECAGCGARIRVPGQRVPSLAAPPPRQASGRWRVHEETTGGPLGAIFDIPAQLFGSGIMAGLASISLGVVIISFSGSPGRASGLFIVAGIVMALKGILSIRLPPRERR